MDTHQARDHLDTVANIVRHADRSLHVPGWIFVIWGLFGTAINAVQQVRALGASLPGDSVIQLPLLLLAIGLTVLVSRRAESGRETFIDRQTGILFSVVFAVMLITSLTLQHRVLSYEAVGLFWGLGFAIALIVSGLESSRPLLLGGLALLAACIATAWLPDYLNGLLAVGWFAGMVLPGIVLLRRRDDG